MAAFYFSTFIGILALYCLSITLWVNFLQNIITLTVEKTEGKYTLMITKLFCMRRCVCCKIKIFEFRNFQVLYYLRKNEYKLLGVFITIIYYFFVMQSYNFSRRFCLTWQKRLHCSQNLLLSIISFLFKFSQYYFLVFLKSFTKICCLFQQTVLVYSIFKKLVS